MLRKVYLVVIESEPTEGVASLHSRYVLVWRWQSPVPAIESVCTSVAVQVAKPVVVVNVVRL